ncbi:MAG: ABC transporter ATP-binding protein [Firmicutes bacterium]|nr:ABC transporter ATP-binding protein [Bacillota bacterium]
MLLQKALPSHVASALEPLEITTGDILLATDTDLDRAGNYSEQWIVVSPSRVLCVSRNHEATLIELDFPVSDIRSARVDPRVGTGFLELELGDGYHEVLRFSNANAAKFAKVAQKIGDLVHGRPLVISAEDNADARRCPKCGLMLGATGGVCPRCLNKGTLVLRLLKLMSPYWGYGGAMLGLLLAGISLDLLPPKLTKTLVDSVFGVSPAPPWFRTLGDFFGASSPVKQLALLVSGLALAQFLRIGINIANGRLAATVGSRIAFDLRQKMYRKLQEVSVAYYDRNQVGQIMTRITQDVDELHGFVWQITNGLVVNVFLLVGIGLVLFTMNTRLALYTLIPSPLVVGSTYVFWSYVMPRYKRYWDRRSKLAGSLASVLSGIRVVKAFAQEERESGNFAAYSNRLREARLRVDKATSTFNPAVSFVFGLGGLIVWFAGGRDVLSREITLGTLMAFFGYLGMFYGPLSQLTSMSQWVTTFTTAAHRIFEVLDSEPEVTEKSDVVKIDIKGDIEFDHVSFGYEQHIPVLRDINLKIHAGEMIGIVGPSGSGKTTIINLICRFYDPDEGAVRIDGVDLRNIHKGCLRNQIGLVLQEPFLFRGTVAENIAYGRPDTTIEEIMDAAKAANAHDFIIRFPDGYNTRLGESGSGLSGGERQRVSIARALLCNPKILILDEATSSVDTESERAIQDALSVLTKGRTTIAIAHRLSTLKNSDRILVVEDGRMREMGTHDELMSLGGLYYRLVKIQTQLSKDTQDIDSLAEREAVEVSAPAGGGRS